MAKERTVTLTKEDHTDTRLARLSVRECVLVGFKTGEPDGHLGHNSGEDGTETLVQSQGCFSFDDVRTRGDETSGFRL